MKNKPTGIEAMICEDIARRQWKGILKYGVTVEENPLEIKEWLQHAYEECLDQAVYLRRAIHELGESNSVNTRDTNSAYAKLFKAARDVVDARHYMGDDGWDKLKNAICELEGIVGRS